MKVALAVDFLTSENHYTTILKSFIELYPDCEIFAMAHIVGEVSEFIEQRKITSSFLSRFIKQEKDLNKFFFLFQAAASSIFIPCCFDKIIFISSGWSLNYKYCQKSSTSFYRYNDFYNSSLLKSKGFINKFFKSFVFNKFESSINEFKGIRLDDNLPPPFSVKDFPLFPKGIKEKFKKHYVSINCIGVNENEIISSIKLAQSYDNIKIVLFGNTRYLKTFLSEKLLISTTDISNKFLIEEKLDPLIHSTILASSIILVDLTIDFWPVLAIVAIKMKIPALVDSNWKEYSYFKNIENILDFSKFKQSNAPFLTIDNKELKVLIYDNMAFKRKIKNILNY